MNNQKNDINRVKKKCSKCGEDKTLNNFYFVKRENRYELKCKECRPTNYRKLTKEEKEKKKLINKKSLIKHKEKYYKKVKEYYNKTKHNKKDYYKEKHENYVKNNREKVREYNKSYLKKYFKNNNNIKYKIERRLRGRLLQEIKKGIQGKEINKFCSALILLNCKIEFFIKYIESQFEKEMTWENWGKVWELDHIKGCCNFDLTKLEEQKKCFNYKNLRPLFKTSEIAESFGYIGYIGNRNKSKYEIICRLS